MNIASFSVATFSCVRAGRVGRIIFNQDEVLPNEYEEVTEGNEKNVCQKVIIMVDDGS